MNYLTDFVGFILKARFKKISIAVWFVVTVKKRHLCELLVESKPLLLLSEEFWVKSPHQTEWRMTAVGCHLFPSVSSEHAAPRWRCQLFSFSSQRVSRGSDWCKANFTDLSIVSSDGNQKRLEETAGSSLCWSAENPKTVSGRGQRVHERYWLSMSAGSRPYIMRTVGSPYAFWS